MDNLERARLVLSKIVEHGHSINPSQLADINAANSLSLTMDQYKAQIDTWAETADQTLEASGNDRAAHTRTLDQFHGFLSGKGVPLPSMDDISQEVIAELEADNPDDHDRGADGDPRVALQEAVNNVQNARDSLIANAMDPDFREKLENNLPPALQTKNTEELVAMLDEAEEALKQNDISAIDEIAPLVLAIHEAEPGFFQLTGNMLGGWTESFMDMTALDENDPVTRDTNRFLGSLGRGISNMAEGVMSSFQRAASSADPSAKGWWSLGGGVVGAVVAGLSFKKLFSKIPIIGKLADIPFVGGALALTVAVAGFFGGRKLTHELMQGGGEHADRTAMVQPADDQDVQTAMIDHDGSGLRTEFNPHEDRLLDSMDNPDAQLAGYLPGDIYGDISDTFALSEFPVSNAAFSGNGQFIPGSMLSWKQNIDGIINRPAFDDAPGFVDEHNTLSPATLQRTVTSQPPSPTTVT